jgi:hypothetical protein
MGEALTPQELVAFLQQNPKHREIIQRAIEIEEEKHRPEWLGWEWYDVRAYPAQLMKLVVAGIIKVNFKSQSSTNYLVIDRETTKRAVKAAQ